MSESFETEKFDSKTVSTEALEVFGRQGISVNTLSLHISMPIQDFETIFPHIEDYKAGIRLNIRGIPVTLQFKPKIPFNEIVLWLEQNIVPHTRKWSKELEQDFEKIKVRLDVDHTHPLSVSEYCFYITLKCRFVDDDDFDELIGSKLLDLELTISLSQMDIASQPKINAFVSWLIDEESGGDFGLEHVSLIFLDQDVNKDTLQKLQRSLPRLYQDLRSTIQTGYISTRSFPLT